MKREFAAFVALALAVRMFVAWRTVMPGRDGVTYLWMAERVAAGEVSAAFTTVFHPLYSLLTGGLLAGFPALSPFAAGQLVAGVAAALATWPLQALTTSCFGVAAGRCTAVLYAFGLWFARYPAECLSEGCFYPVVACWAWCLLGPRPRPVLAGSAAAIAYAIRPEGLVLLALGVLRLGGGARWRLLIAGVLIGLCTPIGYAVFGAGFTLTPKAAFNYAVGIGGTDAALRHYAGHALRLPGMAFEAIGYTALPLAAIGGWWCWRAAQPTARRFDLLPWLTAPILVQALVVPMLRSHPRFLSGFGLLLLPLAGMAMARLLAGRTKWYRCLVWVMVLLPDVARLPAERGADRVIERRLGEWLRALGPPESRFVATEMPRLEYFAGQRPGPPRPIARVELLHAAAQPTTRFVVVVAPRSDIAASDLEQLGLRRLSLPEPLSTMARERALLVYERR